MGLNLEAEPGLQVDAVRRARRTGDRGRILDDWIITITQEQHRSLNPDLKTGDRKGGIALPAFTIRGGCTLIVNAGTLQTRYCLAKDIQDEERIKRYKLAQEIRMAASSGYEQGPWIEREEPFAALRGKTQDAH
jgi:hypothetical protein